MSRVLSDGVATLPGLDMPEGQARAAGHGQSLDASAGGGARLPAAAVSAAGSGSTTGFPAPSPDPVSEHATRRAAPAGSEGHRARLRTRLLAAGPESLADHELLEMVLFLALPRRDTKAVAHALVARFGSFAAAIAAPAPELAEVEGMGEAAVAALRTVQAAAVRLVRAELADRPVLANWDALLAYLTAVLARERVEQFRVLFLDNRNRLLADEAQARGTVNHTPVYPREVMKRALELHATALILVHNHPSGDPTPSRDDVLMTRQVAKAAEALSIVLHDHVVVGNGRSVSFRAKGLL
ncbi:MAG: RadC family protein [Janthinobacterium lividum]